MESSSPPRLVTKVARLYHTRGLRQGEIAARLRLSQPRVSRLLAMAEELDIVRNIVAAPRALNRELEEGLHHRYGLAHAFVVDAVTADDEELTVDLGRAAAPLFAAWASGEAVPRTVGFASWSRTLRHMVGALHPPWPVSDHIVEMLGELGSPTLRQNVAQMTQRLAILTGAQPAFLRAPGVVSAPAVREVLLRKDPHVRWAMGLLDDLDVALLSVGPCKVVSPLRAGDNYLTHEQFAAAVRDGAVGQLCLRFLDAEGGVVPAATDELIIGVTPAQVRRARTRWVVAGGVDKYPILRAALVGGWVDHLVTDTVTAAHLLEVV